MVRLPAAQPVERRQRRRAAAAAAVDRCGGEAPPPPTSPQHAHPSYHTNRRERALSSRGAFGTFLVIEKREGCNKSFQ